MKKEFLLTVNLKTKEFLKSRMGKLSDLIKYSGGISSFGVKENYSLKEMMVFLDKLKMLKINFSDYNLNDGDIVEARSVTDIFTNLITIEGAISTPGDYSLNNIKNVEELISEAEG